MQSVSFDLHKGKYWKFPAVRELNRQGGYGATHIFFNELDQECFIAQQRSDPVAGSQWIWEASEVFSSRPYIESNYGAKRGEGASSKFRVHAQSKGALGVGKVPCPLTGGFTQGYTSKAYYEQALSILKKTG